jgi:hypothetical protein
MLHDWEIQFHTLIVQQNLETLQSDVLMRMLTSSSSSSSSSSWYFVRLYIELGAHPASYPMGTRGSFPGGKSGQGVKLTTHLHLVSRWMNGAIPPLPHYAFMAWCSVKAQEQLYIELSLDY